LRFEHGQPDVASKGRLKTGKPDKQKSGGIYAFLIFAPTLANDSM
jgi:hypothetical protein